MPCAQHLGPAEGPRHESEEREHSGESEPQGETAGALLGFFQLPGFATLGHDIERQTEGSGDGFVEPKLEALPVVVDHLADRPGLVDALGYESFAVGGRVGPALEPTRQDPQVGGEGFRMLG